MSGTTVFDAITISKLRAWLAKSSQQPAEIGMDTRLIDEGVLDSLQMVNFILFIEEIRGQELPEALIQPEYFGSLRIIHETFFTESSRRAQEC